jgi:hypothetical protein
VASNTHSNRTNAHYSNRSNAHRAAKRALGGDAIDGVDFRTYQTSDRRWAWHAKAKGGATGAVKAEKKAVQTLVPKKAKLRPLVVQIRHKSPPRMAAQCGFADHRAGTFCQILSTR